MSQEDQCEPVSLFSSVPVFRKSQLPGSFRRSRFLPDHPFKAACLFFSSLSHSKGLSIATWIWAVIAGTGLSLGSCGWPPGLFAEPAVPQGPGCSTSLPRQRALLFHAGLYLSSPLEQETRWKQERQFGINLSRLPGQPLIPQHTGYELCCCVISCN